jgi:hypothetical protein
LNKSKAEIYQPMQKNRVGLPLNYNLEFPKQTKKGNYCLIRGSRLSVKFSLPPDTSLTSSKFAKYRSTHACPEIEKLIMELAIWQSYQLRLSKKK